MLLRSNLIYLSLPTNELRNLIPFPFITSRTSFFIGRFVRPL